MEFALVLPFLFILFFGSLEAVRVLEAKNNLAMYSREAANTVFINCLEKDVVAGVNHVNICIRQEIEKHLKDTFDQILPGMEIAVHVFKRSGTAWSNAGFYPQPMGLTWPRYTSLAGPALVRLQLPTVSGGATVDNTVDELVPIVIAEVQYNFVPVVWLPFQFALYDVSIY